MSFEFCIVVRDKTTHTLCSVAASYTPRRKVINFLSYCLRHPLHNTSHNQLGRAQKSGMPKFLLQFSLLQQKVRFFVNAVGSFSYFKLAYIAQVEDLLITIAE